MRGAKNEAANRIVDSLKSILSGESSSTAKKGASTLWRATGRALVKKIGKIFLSRDKKDSELALINQSLSQWNRMSKDFDIFGHTVRLARPIATSFSQKITVASWGWPRSARIFLSSTAMRVGPKHEPKYPKNLEAIFLEAFLDAKPRRVAVILLPNRMIREQCIAPITSC